MQASWEGVTGPKTGPKLWECATKAHFALTRRAGQVEEIKEFLASDDFKVAIEMLRTYDTEIKVMVGPSDRGERFTGATHYTFTKNGFQKFVGNGGGGCHEAVKLNEFWDTFHESGAYGALTPVQLLHNVLDDFATKKMKEVTDTI